MTPNQEIEMVDMGPAELPVIANQSSKLAAAALVGDDLIKNAGLAILNLALGQGLKVLGLQLAKEIVLQTMGQDAAIALGLVDGNTVMLKALQSQVADVKSDLNIIKTHIGESLHNDIDKGYAELSTMITNGLGLIGKTKGHKGSKADNVRALLNQLDALAETGVIYRAQTLWRKAFGMAFPLPVHDADVAKTDAVGPGLIPLLSNYLLSNGIPFDKYFMTMLKLSRYFTGMYSLLGKFISQAREYIDEHGTAEQKSILAERAISEKWFEPQQFGITAASHALKNVMDLTPEFLSLFEVFHLQRGDMQVGLANIGKNRMLEGNFQDDRFPIRSIWGGYINDFLGKNTDNVVGSTIYDVKKPLYADHDAKGLELLTTSPNDPVNRYRRWTLKSVFTKPLERSGVVTMKVEGEDRLGYRLALARVFYEHFGCLYPSTEHTEEVMLVPQGEKKLNKDLKFDAKPESRLHWEIWLSKHDGKCSVAFRNVHSGTMLEIDSKHSERSRQVHASKAPPSGLSNSDQLWLLVHVPKPG